MIFYYAPNTCAIASHIALEEAGAGYEPMRIDFSIAQANISINTDAGTLRGLHYQKPPHGEAKLVRCVRGRVFDVVVDMRPESATYCDWYGVELTGERGNALFIPPYVAHGFLTLTPGCEVHYLMGARFEPDAATGVRWNDPAFGITWPREPAILAERDAAYPDLQR